MTELPQELNLPVGTVIQDRYRLVSRIGKGGTGEVYMVEHTLVRRRYALKVLDEALAKSTPAIARFRHEAKATAAIGNPHIVQVVDGGYLDNGPPFLVMELLEGRDLRAELSAEGPFSVGRAIGVATQCCQALEAAHKKGIVHRNMKPENIFITKREDGSDFVKILDFGISKVLQAASGPKSSRLAWNAAPAGTPRYMSVEQLNSCSSIDSRTDVYATGVVLFEMLTGHVPFEAPTFQELLTRIANEPPPSLMKWRPDIPPELEKAIHRSLAKERQERFASMAEMAEALEPFSGNTSRTIISTAVDRESTPMGVGSRPPEPIAQEPQGDPAMAEETPIDVGSRPPEPIAQEPQGDPAMAEETPSQVEPSSSESTPIDVGSRPPEPIAQEPQGDPAMAEESRSQMERTSNRSSALPGLGPPPPGPVAPDPEEDTAIAVEIANWRVPKTNLWMAGGLTGALATGLAVVFALAYANGSGEATKTPTSPRTGSAKTGGVVAAAGGGRVSRAQSSAGSSLPTRTSAASADTPRATAESKRDVAGRHPTTDSSNAFNIEKPSETPSVEAKADKPSRFQPIRLSQPRAKAPARAVASPALTSRQPIQQKASRYQRVSLSQPTAKSPASTVGAPVSPDRRPAKKRKRSVKLHNAVRATVNVTFKCKGASTTVRVSPRGQASAQVPLGRCRVSCTGMGSPVCPTYLDADAVLVEIR